MTSGERPQAPATEAGRRLLWMVETKETTTGRRYPAAFDARLTERLCEDFVSRIEDEAAERALERVIGIVEMYQRDGGQVTMEALIARLRSEYGR